MAIDASAVVHPSALVEPGAVIGAGAQVGPFCHIGPQAVLGAGVDLKSHVVVAGDTVIGTETVVFPFASLGHAPQDLKYQGEASRLRVGARNRIREYVTMNPGTEGGGMETCIGDDCLFMASSHVAHDAQIGNRVILVNGVAIAGHCVIEDDVLVGGLSGVHQFVRIGRGAIIGGLTMVTADVIPYGLVQGPRGVLEGLNLVGLKRRGATRDEIAELRALYAALGKGSLRDTARQAAAAGVAGPKAREMLDFILGPTERSFLQPK